MVRALPGESPIIKLLSEGKIHNKQRYLIQGDPLVESLLRLFHQTDSGDGTFHGLQVAV